MLFPTCGARRLFQVPLFVLAACFCSAPSFGQQSTSQIPAAADSTTAKSDIDKAKGSVATFKCRQVCRRASVVCSQVAKSNRLSMN
jgi:hypothetical protein